MTRDIHQETTHRVVSTGNLDVGEFFCDKILKELELQFAIEYILAKLLNS